MNAAAMSAGAAHVDWHLKRDRAFDEMVETLGYLRVVLQEERRIDIGRQIGADGKNIDGRRQMRLMRAEMACTRALERAVGINPSSGSYVQAGSPAEPSELPGQLPASAKEPA